MVAPWVCCHCALYGLQTILDAMALASHPLGGIVPVTILLLRVTSLAWEGHLLLLLLPSECEDTSCLWPSQSCPYISSELVLKMPSLSGED